jgi:prophage antirepressor-like protein
LFDCFNNNTVRVLADEQGEPWFVASDVAKVLGYGQPDKAIRTHCKCPKLLRPADSPGLSINPRGMTIIPERDVYRLIMRSHLPQAEAFEEWVVGEVLPTIQNQLYPPLSFVIFGCLPDLG